MGTANRQNMKDAAVAIAFTDWLLGRLVSELSNHETNVRIFPSTSLITGAGSPANRVALRARQSRLLT